MPTGSIIKIGDNFTRLTVLAPAGMDEHRKTRWLCSCACGNLTWARTAQLNSKLKQSCGCIVAENAVRRNKAGMTVRALHPEEYDILVHMKARCRKPNEPAYARYGGRGICVCAGFDNFMTFYNLVGSRPTRQHSIDRIDNDGNYSCGVCAQCIKNGWPLNVKWSTKKEQSQNRSITVFLTHDNETHCLAEWGRIKNLNPVTVATRLDAGWTIAEALTIPPSKLNRLNKIRIKGQA